MNEKIRKLAVEAGLVDFVGEIMTKQTEELKVEMFAELLLQEFAYECIDVTNQGERIQWIAKKWGISI